jgi:hypothetical protein
MSAGGWRNDATDLLRNHVAASRSAEPAVNFMSTAHARVSDTASTRGVLNSPRTDSLGSPRTDYGIFSRASAHAMQEGAAGGPSQFNEIASPNRSPQANRTPPPARSSPPVFSPSKSSPPVRPLTTKLVRDLEESFARSMSSGEHEHSIMSVTTNSDGRITKLEVVGQNLDHDLLLHERGKTLAGVGMRLQQERKRGIYVAALTPNGPADMCGEIRIDDVLRAIEGYEVGVGDKLEDVRMLILGPPATMVTLSFLRTAKHRDEYAYKVRLRRAPANTLSEPGMSPPLEDSSALASPSLFGVQERLAVERLKIQLEIALAQIEKLNSESEQHRKRNFDLEHEVRDLRAHFLSKNQQCRGAPPMVDDDSLAKDTGIALPLPLVGNRSTPILDTSPLPLVGNRSTPILDTSEIISLADESELQQARSVASLLETIFSGATL